MTRIRVREQNWNDVVVSFECYAEQRGRNHVVAGVLDEIDEIALSGLAGSLELWDSADKRTDKASIIGRDVAIGSLNRWRDGYSRRYGIVYEPFLQQVSIPNGPEFKLSTRAYDEWRHGIIRHDENGATEALRITWKDLTGFVSVQRSGTTAVISFLREAGKRFDFGISHGRDAIPSSLAQELLGLPAPKFDD